MMSMFHGENPTGQIQGHQEEKEHLTDRLADWLSNVSEDNIDVQSLDEMLDALEAVSPSLDEADTVSELEKFHQDYQSLFVKAQAECDAGKAAMKKHMRNKKFSLALRKLTLTAAALAVLLGGMITIQAFGVDIFGILGRWTDQTFHFGRSASMSATIRYYPMGLNEEVEYDSLSEAAKAFGVEAPVVPQWIPERFRKDAYIFGTVTTSGAMIGANFTDGDNLLMFTLEEANEADELQIEKDNHPPDSYYQGGQYHYIFFDHERLNAIWYNGDLLCRIYGMISDDEARKIIDSIY